MSVNQSVLSCVPSSVTAQNTESGANSILLLWKGQSITWEQETADAAGDAAVDYAIKWNSAVIPTVDKKIANFNAEYDAKKIEYASAKALYDTANQSVKDAEKDIKAATESGDEQYHRETGFVSHSLGGNKRHVVNRRAYDFAMQRKRNAEAERGHYEAQMKNWKKQMDNAKSNLLNAENEKKN